MEGAKEEEEKDVTIISPPSCSHPSSLAVLVSHGSREKQLEGSTGAVQSIPQTCGQAGAPSYLVEDLFARHADHLNRQAALEIGIPTVRHGRGGGEAAQRTSGAIRGGYGPQVLGASLLKKIPRRLRNSTQAVASTQHTATGASLPRRAASAFRVGTCVWHVDSYVPT